MLTANAVNMPTGAPMAHPIQPPIVAPMKASSLVIRVSRRVGCLTRHHQGDAFGRQLPFNGTRNPSAGHLLLDEPVARVAIVIDAVPSLESLDVAQVATGVRAGHAVFTQRLERMQQR